MVPATTQSPGMYQHLSSPFKPSYIYIPDSTAGFGLPSPNATFTSWSCSPVPTIDVSQVPKGSSHQFSLLTVKDFTVFAYYGATSSN